MKRIISAILAVLICASLCVMAFATEENSRVGETITFEEAKALLEEPNEKENESNNKYCALLTEWAYDKQNISDTYADFPEFYGGAYIDDDFNLVIQVTELTDEIVDYFAKIIDLENVSFETVNYPFSTLIAEHDLISEQIQNNPDDDNIANIVGVGISIPENSINLYVLMPKSRANAVAYYANVKESVTAFDNVIIVERESKDVMCDTTVMESGSAIVNNGYIRSMSVWARDINGYWGFVTTPHFTMLEGDQVYVNGVLFGVVTTPVVNQVMDTVFVRNTNPDFVPTNYISKLGTGYRSGGNMSAVGYTVYGIGMSGVRVGRVTDIYYTSSWGMRDLVLTNTGCSPGDSGGIVLGDDLLTHGMIEGMGQYMFYTKYNHMFADFYAMTW